MKNHTEFQILFVRWKKRNYFQEVELLKTKHFTTDEFLKPLILASNEKLSITSACTYYRSLGVKCPSAELVLKCCRDIPPRKIEIHLNHALEQQFNNLSGKVRRNLRKKGVIVIDFHGDPFYGNPRNPHITKAAMSRSTSSAYCYLTADLYSPKGNLTIAVVFRRQGEAIQSMFFDLLARIECFITPKMLLFDGEFSSAKILHELDQRGILYISRRAITARIKPLALAYTLSDNWKNKRRFHVVTVRDKWRHVELPIRITFQTRFNRLKAIVVSPLLTLTADEAIKFYDKRFSIETGYRDKHLFQARTTPINLSVQFVIFLFAIMLWNLWQAFMILASKPFNGYTNRLSS